MSIESIQPIWIAGCGDIGRRVAKIYLHKDQSVNGFVRTRSSQQSCQEVGVNATIADFSQSLDFDPDCVRDAQLFYFAPPPSQGRRDSSLAKFLAHIKAPPQRILLISTTGVYGDSDGEWIDENSPVQPNVDRAYRRADAESKLQQWAHRNQKEFVILRVPGIYALDRLPIKRIKNALPVLRKEDSPYTNRIHADDLARVCCLAMDKAKSGEVFNVTDGHPSTMTEYFDHVADYAGLPRAPKISMARAQQEMSEGMLSYLNESRKISNQKLLDELGVKLDYPSLHETLQCKPRN